MTATTRSDPLTIALLELELGIGPREDALRALHALGCHILGTEIFSPAWYESWDRNQRYGKQCRLSHGGSHFADCPHNAEASHTGYGVNR